MKEVWTEFFTNALQTKMKQQLQQSPPPVEHRQLPSNGVEEPLLKSYQTPVIVQNQPTEEGNSTRINEADVEKEKEPKETHKSNYDKSSAMIMAIEKGDVNTVNVYYYIIILENIGCKSKSRYS